MKNVKNIFENAKFGDRFITRDGTVAIFQKPSMKVGQHADKDGNIVEHTFLTAILFTELETIECVQFLCAIGDKTQIDYQDNGHCFSGYNLNVVSKY